MTEDNAEPLTRGATLNVHNVRPHRKRWKSYCAPRPQHHQSPKFPHCLSPVANILPASYLSLLKINQITLDSTVDATLNVKLWDVRSALHCAQLGEPSLHDDGISTPALAWLKIISELRHRMSTTSAAVARHGNPMAKHAAHVRALAVLDNATSIMSSPPIRHSPDSGVFAAKDRVSDRLGQG